MTITITARDLADHDACHEQMRQFKRRFGVKVVATVTTAVAHAEVFDWNWAAISLLQPPYQERWAEEIRSWSWAPWRDGDGDITHEGHKALARFQAAAFAKAFLAQGGLKRAPRKPVTPF